eukprot:366066-Chlamydomonas_euryale.AAC.2
MHFSRLPDGRPSTTAWELRRRSAESRSTTPCCRHWSRSSRSRCECRRQRCRAQVGSQGRGGGRREASRAAGEWHVCVLRVVWSSTVSSSQERQGKQGRGQAESGKEGSAQAESGQAESSSYLRVAEQHGGMHGRGQA